MINKDAFANGQIDSKLWLCRELENLNWHSNLTRIYAGWYGITGFLLLSRERFNVNRIESYDLDPACESISDMINENWVIKEWKFKAYTGNCNNILPGNPDLIINTSTEHFDSMTWFDNIPRGTRVIVQGNDMPHADHVVHSNTLDDFMDLYPLTSIDYHGSLDFVYPDSQFTRYMMIGTK
jgi:hypothetical protein